MNCDEAHESLSAESDGELSTDERADLGRHLDGCADCRNYSARLDTLERRWRVRPAEPVPDLVAVVTARSRPARLGRGGWIRPALAWVALVILAQNIQALVLGDSAGAEAHTARHLGAFGVALAIGFAFAAWKPHRAFGLLPFTAALVATMTVSAVLALVDGGRSALSEATHVSELVGLVLLWMIAGSPGLRHLPRPHLPRRRATGTAA